MWYLVSKLAMWFKFTKLTRMPEGSEEKLMKSFCANCDVTEGDVYLLSCHLVPMLLSLAPKPAPNTQKSI